MIALKKKKKVLALAAVVGLIAAVYGYGVHISYNDPVVTEYVFLSDKLTDEVKIVALADLHGNTFGENNGELVAAVREQNPDVIFMVGDFLNREDTEHAAVPALAKALGEIAPVYYAIGNHEAVYVELQGDALLNELTDAGAVILDRTYTDIELNGQQIRLGGMLDYAFALDGKDSTNPETMDPEIYDFLCDFQDTDMMKIMLAHRPESFALGEASVTWDVDIVVSGHAHGGQMVLPGIGGLYSPDQGFFPEYVHGLYQKDKINLLVTSGLGSGPTIVRRFNNRPEIVSLTLCPEK